MPFIAKTKRAEAINSTAITERVKEEIIMGLGGDCSNFIMTGNDNTEPDPVRIHTNHF